MPPEDAAACARCQSKLAAVMMEAQPATGSASVSMSALASVMAFGLAHLFDSSEEAMAHLQKILPAEIDRHLAGGARMDMFVVADVPPGHA